MLVHRSDSVRVDSNAFVDAGRNFVQFDKVNGAGSSISGNRGQNELGGTNAEDLISLYQSNGTASSPIRVVGNHLRNGGPSDSGSGIMLGDGGGSYQFVEGNVLVEPGQVGIGVASGTNMTVRGNVVYSSALPWSNSRHLRVEPIRPGLWECRGVGESGELDGCRRARRTPGGRAAAAVRSTTSATTGTHPSDPTTSN